MTYTIKPLPLDPKNVNGLSEKLLVSHYEKNYSGAVRRLNTLTAQLAELDCAKAPVFVINGLKLADGRSWHSICSSIPTTSIMAPGPRPMSTPS
jgi:hypothetical protein